MRHLLALLVVIAMVTPSLAQSGGLINGTRGIPQPNDPSGTTLWGTATVNAAGNAVTAAANATGPVRIVIGGAGTSGNAVLASAGTLAWCTMDASLASAGNAYVVQGATAGQCHPQTTAPAGGTWVIGYVHDPSTTSGSQALVHVNGFLYAGAGGGGGGALSAITAATATNTIANANWLQTWNWALTGTTAGMTFGEGAANAAAGCNGTTICPLVAANTLAGSLTTPLAITQAGVPASATSIPALQITSTYPASAASSAFEMNISNASGGTTNNFFQFSGGSTGTSLVSKMDLAGDLYLGAVLSGISNSSNIRICGGPNGLSACTPNVSATLGGAWIQGSDNSNITTGRPGFALLRGGMLTGAFVAGQTEGSVQIAAGFAGSTINAAFDIVCASTTTAFTVTDCGTAAMNVIGIATNTGTTGIGVVVAGTVPVNLDNTAVVGDMICQSTTTAGLGHSNGPTTACASNAGVGVVIAISGNVSTMTTATTVSTSQALAGNLPLVMLHLQR